MLRIDINLVFTIINVLLLFAIVKIFLIKPVHKILDKRRQEVEDKYAEADKVNEEALATKQKYDESIHVSTRSCSGRISLSVRLWRI